MLSSALQWVWRCGWQALRACVHDVQVRLPPEVNRVIFCRNLPFKISAEEMYDIFGKFGAIRQIRV
jgi:hypothetical protein